MEIPEDLEEHTFQHNVRSKKKYGQKSKCADET
jgi:hypothetical protein